MTSLLDVAVLEWQPLKRVLDVSPMVEQHLISSVIPKTYGTNGIWQGHAGYFIRELCEGAHDDELLQHTILFELKDSLNHPPTSTLHASSLLACLALLACCLPCIACFAKLS